MNDFLPLLCYCETERNTLSLKTTTKTDLVTGTKIKAVGSLNFDIGIGLV